MRRRPRLALAVWPLLLLAVAGCRHHAWDGECDVVVLNTSQCAVTVFVDGWEGGDRRARPHPDRGQYRVGATHRREQGPDGTVARAPVHRAARRRGLLLARRFVRAEVTGGAYPQN